MDLKTYILPGYKLTLADGQYRDIEDVEEDIDEVQNVYTNANLNN